MKNTKLLALLLGVGLGASACSSTTGPEGDPSWARSYVEDYAVAEDGADGVGGAVNYDSAGPEVARPVPVVVPGPPTPPSPDEENTFTDVGDSGWIRVQEESTSTFALDVDTGSFRVAQAMLAEGMALAPDSIRVEEWVNAFEYGDGAAQQAALGLQVETGAAPRADDGTALVRVGVSSREVADEDRPPANITFVIDTSGSMDIRERLGLVQSSLALLVDSLNPQDTIAVVTYGDDATPLLEPTAASDRDTIIDAIDSLEPGGSTNLEAGLRTGYEQARSGHREDGINVVVLASDGVANAGVTDGGELAVEIAGAGEEGIHLVTVGYGMGSYNDTLMEQLANEGDGFYAYLDTFEEAQELFVEDLTTTLTVVARDAKSQVEFDPEFVESYRLIGYQNRALDHDEFRDDTVDAGEVGAGHRMSALYELIPARGVAAGTEVGEARLRWTDPDSGQVSEVSAPISWEQEGASDTLRLAAAVADSAELLKGNEVVNSRGVTVDDLRVEAIDLASREVTGAQDLVDLLDDVADAESAQSPKD